MAKRTQCLYVGPTVGGPSGFLAWKERRLRKQSCGGPLVAGNGGCICNTTEGWVCKEVFAWRLGLEGAGAGASLGSVSEWAGAQLLGPKGFGKGVGVILRVRGAAENS